MAIIRDISKNRPGVSMRRFIFLVFLLSAIPLAAFSEPAEIFAVQIGSYKQFAADARESVSRFGIVHVLTYNKLSRVTVGEFASREKAVQLLEKLKQAGYQDAFVRKIGFADLSKVQSDIEKFNILLAEMDAQVFYLDEYKYIFEGSGYIQLPRSLEVDGIKLAE